MFLVLWLFFSFRYSFWVTMGLPVSFLGALFVLPMIGVTINMISMVGLLIGIGLLMDDAIVIAENIAARMAKGDTPTHAAIDGVTQVLPGILSSFATTLLVFGSLAFITGEIGQILRGHAHGADHGDLGEPAGGLLGAAPSPEPFPGAT